MGRIKFSLTNVLFYTIIILSCFFLENIALLTTNINQGFDNFTFFGFASLITVLIVFYIVIEAIKNKTKINWIIFSILLILYICITLMTLMYKETTYGVHTVSFSPLEKAKAIIQLSLAFVIIYLCFTTYQNKIIKPRVLNIFLYTYVLVCVISIICSFFLDLNSYKAIFKDPTNNKGVASFYFNENTYGMSLLLGILSLFALNVYKKRWWNFLLIFIFLTFQLFSTCATSLLISLITIVIYIAFETFFRINKHLKASIALIVIVLFLVVGIIIANSLLYSNNVDWAVNFNNFIDNHVLNKNIKTITGRTTIWKSVIDLLKESPLHFIFGYGTDISTKIFRANFAKDNPTLPPFTSTHNAYVEILLQGGILGLVIYLGFILYLVVVLIKLFFKKHFEFSFVYFICLLSILASGWAESYIIFSPKTLGMFTGLSFVIPVLVLNKNYKKEESNKAFANQYDSNAIKLDLNKLSSHITSLLFGVFMCGLGLFLNPFTYQDNLFKSILLLFVILMLLFIIFIPNLFICFINTKSKKRAIFRVIFHFALILIFISGLGVTFYLNKVEINTIVFVLPILTFLLLFVYNFIFTAFKGDFKSWFINLFNGCFKTPKYGFLGIVFSIIIFNLIVPIFYSYNYLSIVLVALIGFASYLLFLYIVPSSINKYCISYLNQCSLARQKQFILNNKY